MRLTSDITLPSKRSTNEASYKQIIDDLNIAKDLLPDRPQIVTRASKTAALALLARIYLSMENYDMAFQSADQCLKIYSALLDYNNVIASANFIGVYNSEVLFHANYSDNFTTTNYLIDRGLYESYQGDDLRKSRLFRENATTKVVTFKGNYDSGTSLIFCGLATDEVYLIRAECYARAGKITDSMRDLNDLMKMRWDKTKIYPVITANDQEDAIRKILLERRKELVNRGIRWSDLRRLNKDSRFAVTLKRTVLGVEYTLEPNSYRYTFPIPDDIVQQIGITQNPGW
jgi:tetratricopeptide (TPR) repeat protein